MFSWVEDSSLKYLKVNSFSEYGIKAYFTSRLGGVSSGIYNSLNLGFHAGDGKLNVIKNRQLIADSIGVFPASFVAAEQVHGDKVYIVNKDNIGAGALKYQNSLSGIDAIITEEKGIPLLLLYADCVPLFFVDPIKRIVALAHAGWKGTVKKIAKKIILLMKEKYGVKAKNILVAIGPSISKDFYEVDDIVIKQFRKSFDNPEDFIVDKGKGHYLLDLWQANIDTLKEVGIIEEHVTLSNYCTFRNNQYFYSYRKEKGKTGRMASIIYL